MKIVLNGKARELEHELTVVDLLQKLGITTPGTAIAVNNDIIARDEHEVKRIGDGDRVEIIRPIGGG